MFLDLEGDPFAGESVMQYLYGFAFKNTDGVPLKGLLLKPDNFDPKKKYPIIAHVYPGPQTEGVTYNFTTGGVQCVFNCVGSSQSMKDCAGYVTRGGRIVVIGEEPEFPSIDTTEIAQRELEIVGSRNGTRQDLVEALQLLRIGVVKPYIAARFPLREVNAAFECMRGQPLGRVVVVVMGGQVDPQRIPLRVEGGLDRPGGRQRVEIRRGLGTYVTARRFEHTVVGEIVNLASRIENLTRTLDIAILISDAVVEAVEREVGHPVLAGFVQVGAQAIRGHQKPIGRWGLTALAIGVD
jgi:hypothetical protein